MKEKILLSWLMVMTLAGVDFFSTYGYLSGVIYQAMHQYANIASVMTVCFLLLFLVPAYRKIVETSTEGQGSLGMTMWQNMSYGGKVIMLVLIGSACSDFIVTIALSCADAAAHGLHEFHIDSTSSRIFATIGIVTVICLLYQKLEHESTIITGPVVFTFLAMVLLICIGSWIYLEPIVNNNNSDPFMGLSFDSGQSHEHEINTIWDFILRYPQSVVSISGFETAAIVIVAFHTLEKGDIWNIKQTKKLILTMAIIGSIFIPLTTITVGKFLAPQEIAENSSHVLVYLGSKFLPQWFMTIFTWITVIILALASISGIVGIVTLVRKYLVIYGFTPDIKKNIIIATCGFIVTILTVMFLGDAVAMSGAYAIGVLIMLTNALSQVRKVSHGYMRFHYTIGTLILTYMLLVNCYMKPTGFLFTIGIISLVIVGSFIFRMIRQKEIKVEAVENLPNINEEIVKILCVKKGRKPITSKPIDFILCINVGNVSNFADKILVAEEKENCTELLSPCVASAIVRIGEHYAKQGKQVHFYLGEPSPHGFTREAFAHLFTGHGLTLHALYVLRQCLNESHQKMIHFKVREVSNN